MEDFRLQEKGFTLVELAIVMIIIGLLIAGLLKGQELVSNSRVNATIAQINGMSTAIHTFRDKYNALPGDILNPELRLPGCANFPGPIGCVGNSNGDGLIELGERYWMNPHLASAGLLSGYSMNGTVGVWGPNTNRPKLVATQTGRNAGLFVQTLSAATITAEACGLIGTTPISTGLYIYISNFPACDGDAALTPNEAFQIDKKMDDRMPSTGTVRGEGENAGTAADCGTATEYAEASTAVPCNLYIRIQ
jgi:prepilin-type N-terminal cleavage/methylation domain-containing protein